MSGGGAPLRFLFFYFKIKYIESKSQTIDHFKLYLVTDHLINLIIIPWFMIMLQQIFCLTIQRYKYFDEL